MTISFLRFRSAAVATATGSMPTLRSAIERLLATCMPSDKARFAMLQRQNVGRNGQIEASTEGKTLRELGPEALVVFSFAS
jgi:hypothetical protein